MKKIYELVFQTNDGVVHNIIFSSKKKANYYAKKYYAKGSIYIEDYIITKSIIYERTLF